MEKSRILGSQKVAVRKPTRKQWAIVAVVIMAFSVVTLVSFELAERNGIILPPGTTLIFLGLLVSAMCVIFIPMRVRFAFFRVIDYLLRK